MKFALLNTLFRTMLESSLSLESNKLLLAISKELNGLLKFDELLTKLFAY